MGTLIQLGKEEWRSITGFCPVTRQLGGFANLPLGEESQGYPEQEAIDYVTHISLFSFPVSFCLLPHPDLGTISRAPVSGSALCLMNSEGSTLWLEHMRLKIKSERPLRAKQ